MADFVEMRAAVERATKYAAERQRETDQDVHLEASITDDRVPVLAH